LSCIYIPAKNADDWAQLLADPVKQWRIGYSARTLAYSWQCAEGFPDEIKAAFSTNEFLSDIQRKKHYSLSIRAEYYADGCESFE
jgi:hypothetical protein